MTAGDRDLFVGAAAHVDARLTAATRIEEPFPHVRVDRLMPDDLYERLAGSWPADEVFWSERPEQRLDLVPKPPGLRPADSRADGYDRLPPSVREVWDFFVLEINRRVIGPHLERLFAAEIGARVVMLADSQRQGIELPPYLQPPFRPQMNVGRLMGRGYGYRLRPHVDALAYLVTALHYFPRGDDEAGALGTTLYKAERELNPADLLARGKTAYFDDAGITVEPVAQIPFVGNTLLAFANTGRSAHGMRITTKGVWRRAYQSHLSLKGDHHHL